MKLNGNSIVLFNSYKTSTSTHCVKIMSRYHQSYGKNYGSKNTSQYYGGRRNQSEAQLSQHELAMMKSSFDLFDLDGSGKISKDEFRNTVRCLGYNASDEEIDKMMSTHDTDGDGMMDFNEFLALMKHLKSEGFTYGKQSFEQEIKKAFRILDADGNGYLTPGELRYVLCNTGNRLTRPEIEDFIKRFDKDNDGRVSCQELINIMCSSLEDHIKKLLP